MDVLPYMIIFLTTQAIYKFNFFHFLSKNVLCEKKNLSYDDYEKFCQKSNHKRFTRQQDCDYVTCECGWTQYIFNFRCVKKNCGRILQEKVRFDDFDPNFRKV